MFRFLLIVSCLGYLATPALSKSAGAPVEVCHNGLAPEHGVAAQRGAAPYSLSGDSKAADGKVSLTLGGAQGFLGFVVQGQDASGKPVGTFKIVEGNKSQLLTCSAPGDTLTHVKIPRGAPIKSVAFDWIPPAGYAGKVKIVATVVQDGGTFWVGNPSKEIEV